MVSIRAVPPPLSTVRLRTDHSSGIYGACCPTITIKSQIHIPYIRVSIVRSLALWRPNVKGGLPSGCSSQLAAAGGRRVVVRGFC